MRNPFEARRASADGILPLINIVFLLLVFFLLVGTVAPRPDVDLDPPTTVDRPPDRLPPGAAYVSAQGVIFLDGRAVSAAALADLLADLPADKKARFDVLPDRDLDAWRLIEVAEIAAAAGIGEVRLITRRGGAR